MYHEPMRNLGYTFLLNRHCQSGGCGPTHTFCPKEREHSDMCAKTVWYLFMSRLSTIVSSLSDYSGCTPFALASSITINQPLPFPISSQGPFPTHWMIIKYSVSREHETVFGSWPSECAQVLYHYFQIILLRLLKLYRPPHLTFHFPPFHYPRKLDFLLRHSSASQSLCGNVKSMANWNPSQAKGNNSCT